MSRARILVRRCLTPAVAAALLGGVAAVVPAAPAAAATAITVTPSTNLVQGQTVSVSGTGYPPNAGIGILECAAGAGSIGECDLRFNPATTDANGAFANAPFSVNQVISTSFHGVLNCAVDACAIAVGTVLDQGNVALAPITMTNTLGPPSVAFDPRGPFVVDANGRVTAAADLSCHVTGTIIVRFQVGQGGAVVNPGTGVIVDCTDGATVHVISDYITTGFSPGPMTVTVSTDNGSYPVRATAAVTLQSEADARAALAAALQGPNGAQVFAQLITDLRFRLLHNPVFAHEFFVAILQQLAAGH